MKDSVRRLGLTSPLWHQDHRAFEMSDCQALADDLRRLLLESPARADMEHSLAGWIMRLQMSSDEVSRLRFFNTRRDVGDLIQFVLLADEARDSGSLKETSSPC